MPHINLHMIVKNDFIKLKNKEINERIVLEIINHSQVVFSDKTPFEQIVSQSNSEPDFKSITSDYMLDAKLFFPATFWKKSSFDNESPHFDYVNKWMDTFNNYMKLPNDLFYESDPGNEIIEDMKNFSNNILKVTNKKNIILFLPFCIFKIRGTFMANLQATGQEHWILDILKQNNIKNDIYLLALTYENFFFLSKLTGHGICEFIEYDFSNYLVAHDLNIYQ